MAPTKTFNLAGIKFSFAVIENTELRDRFCCARAGLVGGYGVFGNVAALAAYRDGRPWMTNLLRYLEGNRDYLLEYVRSCLPGISAGPIEGTYLAWLDCRQAGLPGTPYEFFLGTARVGLNDGATFGRGGDGFCRLNFGCPRATLAEALDRMRRAVEVARA
jgi:cystathionine beta-lyase